MRLVDVDKNESLKDVTRDLASKPPPTIVSWPIIKETPNWNNY